MSLNDYLVSANGYSVTLLGSSVTAASIARLGAPWLSIHRGRASGAAFVVVAGSEPTDGKHVPYREQDADGPMRTVLIDSDRRRVYVPMADRRWAHMQVLRTVRNLLRWQALADGNPCLHGGLVDMGGAGIAVLGRKKAGKTSTILAAICTHRAGFVSNDDVTLVRSRHRWTGVGWPRSINIRSDAALAMAVKVPAIGRLREASSHPRKIELASDAATFTVLPRDIFRELDAIGRPSVPVRAIVFPRFVDDPQPNISRLDPEVALDRLTEVIDGTATDHDKYLHDWFRELKPSEIDAHAGVLAETLPCFELTQHLGAVVDASNLLARLAHSFRRDDEYAPGG